MITQNVLSEEMEIMSRFLPGLPSRLTQLDELRTLWNNVNNHHHSFIFVLQDMAVHDYRTDEVISQETNL